MKRLVLIRGPIFAGKTTIAGLLRERLGEASKIDFDELKLQIDDTKSSLWRQELALKTSLFLTRELTKFDRTIIVDIHSSKENQYREYQKVAAQNGYFLFSFLLRPPLEVCLARSRVRDDSNLKYKISEEKITEYWRDTFHIEGEMEFDTSKLTPEKTVSGIMAVIGS